MIYLLRSKEDRGEHEAKHPSAHTSDKYVLYGVTLKNLEVADLSVKMLAKVKD